MATIPKFPPSYPKPRISEQLASELQKTDGSISKEKHGTVYGGLDTQPWDMSKEWRGAELRNYDWRNSKWSKTIVVRFYVESPLRPGRLSKFTLHLQPPLTDDEVKQIAETYMMVLNMRRIEKGGG